MSKKTDIKQNKNKIVIGAVIILAFIFGWIFGAQDAKLSQVGYTPKLIERNLNESSADFSVFWRAWDLIVEKYDGEVNYQQMIYGAIKGMTESLGDPYTVFMTPEEARELDNELSGVVYGIGAEVGIKNNKLTIISPLSGSPAENAGLQPGDVITHINGELTAYMGLDEAVYKIRGEEGTVVKLTIQRDNSTNDHEITRAKVTVESVSYKVLEDNIGFVEISRFDENTTSKLQDGLDEFISKNIKKIVIDLRGNPGGYLDESISVSSEFLKEGVVVTEKKDTDNDGKKYEYKASGRGRMTDDDVEIIILTNEGSASASEIVAGALKDHKRATLVGETTFGKGSVQEIEHLSAGSKMRITVAHWYTPSGLNISEKGIEPDHIIELTEEDYNNDNDPQLKKAIELLK